MKTETFYLNNYGSRWIKLINGKRQTITLKTKAGKTIIRKVIFFEAFGNFVTALISYKGKKISVFSDTILED